MSDLDVRWIQRFQNFNRAFQQLVDAADLAKLRPLTSLEQQGLIQAFEFTHELAWNTLKDFLESRGASQIYGSRDATRQAFAAGLIANGEKWMDMVVSRNRSTHTYDLATAQAVANAVTTEYVAEFDLLQESLTRLAGGTR